MTSIGAKVVASAPPQESIEALFIDGSGGMVSGEDDENGMNDFRLGNQGEPGKRLSCWRMAKSRKCRVR